MALLLGGQDPNVWLDREDIEWKVQQTVLKEAVRLDEQRRKALVQAIGVSVGNSVAKALSKLFK